MTKFAGRLEVRKGEPTPPVRYQAPYVMTCHLLFPMSQATKVAINYPALQLYEGNATALVLRQQPILHLLGRALQLTRLDVRRITCTQRTE